MSPTIQTLFQILPSHSARRPPGTSTTLTSGLGVVTALSLTPSSILVALDTGDLHVLNREGKNERVVKVLEGGVWALDFWADGKEELVVAGGVRGELGVWKFVGDQLKEKVRLVGHSGTVRSVKALSANRAISGSKDGTVRLWNIERGGCEALFEGHSATIRSLAFHGDLAVSASYDNDARVWRLAFHGDLAVSASYDNDARVWRLEEKKCSHVLKGHESSLYAVAFDGQRIVTGSLDRTARIWDPTTGTCQAILEGHGGLVGQIQLLRSVILTGDSNGSIRIWSTENYSKLRKIDAHKNSVTGMRCKGSRIVSGSSDGMVKLWDMESGELVKELTTSDAVWKVGFLKEEILAVFSQSNRVTLGIWENPITG